MSITTDFLVLAAGSLLSCSVAVAASAGAAPAGDAAQPTPHVYGFGTDATQAELQGFFSSMPDGRDLPEGSGTVLQGQKVYAAQCIACHGANLEGGIGDRLIGGRGTLAAASGPAAIKTVESYWPYATTLFDYVKRAMPFTAPGSLSSDDVYAVTAYILNQAKVVPDDAVMSKETLPKVVMPNHDGFRPADR